MLSLFFLCLFWVPFALAIPAYVHDTRSLPHVPRLNLCSLPLISCFVCQNNEVQVVYTPMGLARGMQTTASAVRFSVKYATAARFQPPVMATSWVLPRNLPDGTPPPCPQDGVDPSVYSEDCLYLNIYAPVTARPGSNLPILVWIHGGSYRSGSASDAGLDGSYFAQATNSIVVVVQYRLGILGYLPPTAFNSNKNLGVQDVIMALKYVNKVAASFGGDKNAVTIAGQSSGGNMVRNLLAAPAAANYFRRAIMESDPIGIGFMGPTTFTTLQGYFYKQLPCGDCLSTSVQDIITAQTNFASTAFLITPGASLGEPTRPVLDGSVLTTSLTTSFPSNLKPLLLTTVKDEGLTVTYFLYSNPVPAQDFVADTIFLLGSDRANSLANTTFYPYSPNDTDIRPVIANMFTDGSWRCPTATLAQAWAAHGGTAYVGEFTLGATYPGNEYFAGCTSGGVCHQDDIFIVFGTTPNPSAAQSSLTAEVQGRWSAFMRGGAPNVSGKPTWNPVPSSGPPNVLNLGGTSTITEGACTPSFWGSFVKFDYQLFSQ